MGRSSNAEVRRVQIVEGLRTVMAKRGYDGASIVLIARAAGLTSGLVHYHFRNKAQILLALVDRLAAQLEARIQARFADEAEQGAWARLDGWIDAHVATTPSVDADAVACWVVIGAEAVRDEAVRGVYQAAVSRDVAFGSECLRNVFVAEGLGDDQEASARVAAALVAAMEGYYQLSVAAPDLVPPGSAAASVRSMARGLVAAETAAA
jgi:TetR/AcrR family transcriptional repressor of bet genes